MGLLTTLAGIRSGPGTSAPKPEPATDGAPFVNALMQALGLSDHAARTDDTLMNEAPTDGADLHSLLAMLAESSEADADTPVHNADTANSGNSPFGGTFGVNAPHGFSDAATDGVGRSGVATGAPLGGNTLGTASVDALTESSRHPASSTGDTATDSDSTSTPVDSTSTTVHADLTSESPGLDAAASSESMESVHGSDSSASESATVTSESATAPSASTTAPSESATALSEALLPTTAAAADEHSVPGAAERIAAAGVSGAGKAATSDLPVTEADPSLDKVAPALRAKVEQVIDRMRAEFGHEVTVVEGYRSSDRQAHLYEQGRSRPGQVATWTRRSWHSEGLAADLMVDGTYEDPLAYARLQRVAREVGLKTLGSRDMGHVELPGSTAEPEVTAARSGRRFVGVAQPAPAAAVAAVAQAATPGQWVTDTPAEPAVQALSAEVDVIADASTNSESEAPPSAETAVRSDFGSRLADATSTSGPTNRIGGIATAMTEAGAAEQAARIQELRAMTEAAQPTRVSVRLDGGDQVRVGLLDRTVDASLDISDPDAAADVRNRVSELYRGLESRGLDLGALNVNGTAGTSATNSWLGGAGDPASELIRTLLGGGAGERGNDGRGSERTFTEERTRNQERSDSNRSRRDADQERKK